ncbi:MAG: HAD-IA family hydrolase [Candidatus Brocadiaceae bacterium]|jgi:HAD superfamily hydrolase (TIGR01509 family)
MKNYQAVFLDRDETLSRISPAKVEQLSRLVGQMVGRPDLQLSWSDHMERFERVFDLPRFSRVNTVELEHEFWRRLYATVLQDLGVEEEAGRLADELYEACPFYRMMEPFPETVGVLEALRSGGYRLGVISDTFPSLRLALEAMGIAAYFESFTASAVVGAGKPDPRIFRAATDSLGVRPEESVFVDDTEGEVEGARELGFTAFHLDRTRTEPDFSRWKLGNLRHLIEYLELG